MNALIYRYLAFEAKRAEREKLARAFTSSDSSTSRIAEGLIQLIQQLPTITAAIDLEGNCVARSQGWVRSRLSLEILESALGDTWPKVQAGEAHRLRELRLEFAEDEQWINLEAVPWRDARGAIVGALISAVIVTPYVRQRAASERKVSRQKTDLAALERSNEELSEFSYIASHDLNAPLRAIRNLADWAMEDSQGEMPEASAAHLTLLRERVDRMQRLLNDLLDYSRVTDLRDEVEQIDASALVRELFEVVQNQPEIRLEGETELPIIQGPKAVLALVFRNLLDNALKHHDQTVGRVTVASSRDTEGLIISISDDGPGIKPEHHEAIFRPFHRLEGSNREGSGMGLAIVRRTLERYGGKVWIESTPGRGTSFFFRWPDF